jgi:PPP family 3-phenylpropionic acid transporter
MTHDRRGGATSGSAAGAKLSTGAFAVRLSVYYAALCLVFGVHMPFFPVWLDARGLDAGQIGLVLALPMVVRVLTVPFIAREVDRRNALQLAILIASLASVVCYAALGFVSSVAAITLGFIAASIAFTPIMPLTEAYALHELPRRGRAYGPVRLWGSVSFIAATIGAGYLADLIVPGHLIWVIVAMLGVNALGALLLPATEPHPPAEDAPRASALLRDRAFLAVIAAAGLIQASHATFYGFSTLDWKASGIGGVTIGLLWSIGVIAEIVLFAMSARLPPFLGPANLLLIGAIAGLLRWTAMAMSPPFWMLPFLQSLHALSYGATHLGTLGLVTRIAPRRLGATAQSYLSIVLGLTMAAATGLAGALFEAYGALSYAAMAVLAGAGAGTAIYGRTLWRDRAS